MRNGKGCHVEPIGYKDYEPAFCRERHRLTEENVSAKIERVEQVLTMRLNGMDVALDVKTRELDRRLDGLNELREEVVRDREQYARKENLDAKIDAYDKWITIANEKLTRLLVEYETRINKAGMIAIIAVLVSVSALISNIFFHYKCGRP